VRPSGVLILVGRDNKSIAVNCKNCTPCHLAISKIEAASLVHAKLSIDLSCEICNMPHDDHVMVLCDSCNRGYHIYCLTPPLTKVPPGIWVYSEFSQSGFTPLTIETLWATDRFHRDAKRALEFRPTSGPHHKQQGRSGKTTALATATSPVTLVPPKRGPGRPKKVDLTSNMILLPSYQWSLTVIASQGPSDLMPGVLDPTYPAYPSSWSSGGAFFQSHFITTSINPIPSSG
jgi:hypothetical protein